MGGVAACRWDALEVRRRQGRWLRFGVSLLLARRVGRLRLCWTWSLRTAVSLPRALRGPRVFRLRCRPASPLVLLTRSRWLCVGSKPVAEYEPEKRVDCHTSPRTLIPSAASLSRVCCWLSPNVKLLSPLNIMGSALDLRSVCCSSILASLFSVTYGRR